jgi:two-component system, cell cycle response regulator DivK
VAKRILVVEDNDLNRKLFCDVLKSQGYAVEPVSDGREALDRARQFVPNLIIMDIQLAEISGVELIEQAKADPVLRPIPVLAVTA